MTSARTPGRSAPGAPRSRSWRRGAERAPRAWPPAQLVDTVVIASTRTEACLAAVEAGAYRSTSSIRLASLPTDEDAGPIPATVVHVQAVAATCRILETIATSSQANFSAQYLGPALPGRLTCRRSGISVPERSVICEGRAVLAESASRWQLSRPDPGSVGQRSDTIAVDGQRWHDVLTCPLHGPVRRLAQGATESVMA